jgi:hypothetical protein
MNIHVSDREIDAVRAPTRYAGQGAAAARLERLISEFSVVLGTAQVFVRQQGSEHFITADPGDTLQFPRSGPRSGESRYRWEDRGDGIFYGRLAADG